MKSSCDAKNWATISMKTDFATIYGKNVNKQEK